MKKCIRFKSTPSGRRCARFSENDEVEGTDTSHSMVELSLKGYGLNLDEDVKVKDAFAGFGIGVLGAGVVKYLIRQAGLQDKLPVLVQNWMPLLAASAAGTAAYALQRKGSKKRATGHLVGAVGAGVVAQAWGFMKSKYPEYFGDVVAMRFNGYGRNGYGVLVNSPTPRIGPGAFAGRGYGGMIFNNPGRSLAGTQASLAGLGALAMGDDRSGIEELMD